MIRLSIDNFKSVKSIRDFELRPLTMLAGINSSGKTSLIQALLLIKQTIESNSKDMLYLDGPFVVAENLIDLIYQKKKSNTLSFAFEFSRDELSENYSHYLPEGRELETLKVSISFYINGKINIETFRIDLNCGDNASDYIEIKKYKTIDRYNISYSNDKLLDSKKIKSSEKFGIDFDNFFPNIIKGNELFYLDIAKTLKQDMTNALSKIYYIGPQREKPVLAISYDKLSNANRWVGIDGHYTRFVFDNKRDESIEGYNKTLTELCDHWLCKEMNLAKKVSFTKDRSQLYRIIITNNDNLEVDLRQMGFGLSQILPIIVQGFLTPIGGTLIVEDPDVHMHPKVQGDLVDIFIDLTKHGRKVLIETHSDHIVTRLRRRIAEKEISSEEYNVSFVENNEDASVYSKVSITGNGAFDKELPEGFLDAQQNDLQGILEARINSRKNNG